MLKYLFILSLALLPEVTYAQTYVLPFNPGAPGAPLIATFAGTTGSLPTGNKSVSIQNVGANTVICAYGPSANSSGFYLGGGGDQITLTIGVATQLSCETLSVGLTSQINMIPGQGQAVLSVGTPKGQTTPPLSAVSTTLTGTTGTDLSINVPTIPAVGSNFPGTGTYANYVLVTTVPVNSNRVSIDVENPSGDNILLIRDDGVSNIGSVPVNASLIPLAPGNGPGTQGGSWTSVTFKGRVQVYAPSSSDFITIATE